VGSSGSISKRRHVGAAAHRVTALTRFRTLLTVAALACDRGPIIMARLFVAFCLACGIAPTVAVGQATRLGAPDHVLTRGNIFTADSTYPLAEANAASHLSDQILVEAPDATLDACSRASLIPLTALPQI